VIGACSVKRAMPLERMTMTRPLKNPCEIAIVGGGLAGLAAARHAVRLGHLVTLFEGSGLYGGQVATVDHVAGLPIPGEFSGQDLAMPMLEEAQKVGIRVVEAQVTALDMGAPLKLTDSNGDEHHPEAIILASGASLKPLGVPGEEENIGRGVSRCATCDGGFFRKQHVVVVGGGDAAVHEALTLSPIVGKVTMICRSPLRAKREFIDRLDTRDNVEFVWDSEVAEVLSDDQGVTGVRVRNVRDGSSNDIECAGLFPFIGVEPNGEFLPKALSNGGGLVSTGADYATIANDRIFAVGALRSGYGGNAAEAMAEGISAVEAAHRRIAN